MKNSFLKFYLFPLFLIISQLLLSAPGQPTANQQELLKNLPPDQRNSVLNKMNEAGQIQEELDEIFKKENTLLERPELFSAYKQEVCDDCIYGYSMFRFAPSTFAPANQVPITSDYTLGPGDKLKVVLYGSQSFEVERVIARDGFFNLPVLGPVKIAGLTFSEANNYLKDRAKKELLSTDIAISLTGLRSITVYVLGEAYKPGAYTVSSLSTITNTLFVSGGVNKKGSLRNIKIKRAGITIGTYDFYDFLLQGNSSVDLNLEDGDTIFIPFFENTVTMEGAFKRPFLYEFLKGESLQDAINLAGGYITGVELNPVLGISTIDRSLNKRKIFSTSSQDDLTSLVLTDGDAITVSQTSGLGTEIISISGEVKYPGSYPIIAGDKILDVINRAGGYTNQSYSEGAIFLRDQVKKQQIEAFKRSADNLEQTVINIVSQGVIENISEFTLSPITALIQKLRTQEPIGRQVVDLDYLKLKSDPYSNFMMRDGDSIIIPKRPDSVSVVGEVLNPATLKFEPGFSPDKYLQLAGGLNDQADKKKVFIILPNGQSSLIKKNLFSQSSTVMPGSTIVVPRDTRPFDAVQITQIITPILADLATSAAAIAAISN